VDERTSAGAYRLIHDVVDKVSRRGVDVQEWVASWSLEFAQASEAGDEDSCELMLDTLVAFDAWLSSKNPVPRRSLGSGAAGASA
jgi:hypothetical protein